MLWISRALKKSSGYRESIQLVMQGDRSARLETFMEGWFATRYYFKLKVGGFKSGNLISFLLRVFFTWQKAPNVEHNAGLLCNYVKLKPVSTIKSGHGSGLVICRLQTEMSRVQSPLNERFSRQLCIQFWAVHWPKEKIYRKFLELVFH